MKTSSSKRLGKRGALLLPTVEGAEPRGIVAVDLPLHRTIYEQLLREIQTGMYKAGDRLPSEADLCARFGASRITVAKAFHSLQRDGLITRRPGSGSYVEEAKADASRQFGVLIPDFGSTDIFEPICQGIMRAPTAQAHSLTWGSSSGGGGSRQEAATVLCQRYISQGVAGVFFAPAEDADDSLEVNSRLAGLLEAAGIPVVLLDRDYMQYPDRSNFDLVGIDNQRAGYKLTRHLIQAGAARIIFAKRKNSASTVDERAAGYAQALHDLLPGAQTVVFETSFDRPQDVEAMLARERPDGIVCANDLTAAHLMRTVAALGVRIPEDVRMVGVDDVSYAKFLPTPLTTLRQNCAEIGAVAMATMLERIAVPNHPVRDVLVRTELVVRESCGSAAAERTASVA